MKYFTQLIFLKYKKKIKMSHNQKKIKPTTLHINIYLSFKYVEYISQLEHTKYLIIFSTLKYIGIEVYFPFALYKRILSFI